MAETRVEKTGMMRLCASERTFSALPWSLMISMVGPRRENISRPAIAVFEWT
jgi:hypothetical protein